MEREQQETTWAGRSLTAVGLLCAAAGVVAWLSPGGLGEAGTVEVTGGASASAYRSVTGTMADAPSWLGPILEVAAEGTLVILGVLLAWMWWTGIRRSDIRGAAGTVLTGVGTMVAYAISEVVKLVVDQERPCRALRAGTDAIAECPGAGDWSFPSNHATLAAGLAFGLAMLRPRLAVVTLPLAGAAALLRVLVGVHYPHDVLAGAILGSAVAAAVLLVFMPLAQRAASRLGRHWRRNDSGLVSHDRSGSSVVDAQPSQDGTHVGFDRSLHHMQSSGDLAVGQPASEEGQYFPFPGGEGVDPVTGGGPPTGQGADAGRCKVRDDSGRDFR
jgi:membrane-associated phospholipid phosphatase